LRRCRAGSRRSVREGLAVLGEHPDAPGQIWHLPNGPATKTHASSSTSSTSRQASTAPSCASCQALLLRVVGLANPTVRELIEMRYQFDEPFIVDSSKISTQLGVHATPIEQAIADTFATYRTPAAAARRT
jgi:hypothetical protein